MKATARIVADRLYGITLRPQELALYGDRLSVGLHYGPMCDDPNLPATEHFKLLVLEGLVEVPADDSLGPSVAGPIQVVKVGWEVELTCDQPVSPAELSELPEEVPRILARIADTVNELARRAGLEAPFGPEVVDRLVVDYRTRC